MKKSFICIILILFFAFFASNIKAEDNNETSLKIREGAFAKVMMRDEISTLTADIGDEVTFINTQDMYVYETNAIPENTIFYGEIEDVREPVEGRDGALKISIYKMITPDKKVYKLTGHIYNENDNYIGGQITAPVYYHKVPQYSSRLRPMLKMVPLNIYDTGKHTVIKPGAEFFVIFDKDVMLK